MTQRSAFGRILCYLNLQFSQQSPVFFHFSWGAVLVQVDGMVLLSTKLQSSYVLSSECCQLSNGY